MNIKIAIVGYSKVGKTAFIYRHKAGEFIENYKKTEGETITVLKFYTSKGKITAHIYENVKNIDEMDALILMFSLQDVRSLCEILLSKKDVLNFNKVLCGNKNDIKLSINSNEMIMYVAKKLECKYYDVSAKSCYNFEKPFLDIFRQKFGNLTFTEKISKKKEFVYMKLPKELYLKIYDKLNDSEETQKEFEKSIC